MVSALVPLAIANTATALAIKGLICIFARRQEILMLRIKWVSDGNDGRPPSPLYSISAYNY